MDSETVYQRKILVYFDVLGFKVIILKKYKDQPKKIEEILTTMHLISNSSYSSELIIFSDSVINILNLVAPLEKTGEASTAYFSVILKDISSIQMNMVNLFGVLVRGSIVIGDIRYEGSKNLLFGPSLIKAYELESKHSIYPRFIIESEIINLIKEDINSLDISMDTDGHYYIDPFKWMVKLEAEKKELHSLKEKIEQEIKHESEKNNPNLSVLSKYHWFLNKIIEREKSDLRRNRT